MVDLVFRSPHQRDVVDLAAHLRAGDRAELAACGHHDRLAAVLYSVQHSTLCWAALADGQVLCIFGVTPWVGREGVGVPWMLGADSIGAHDRKLIAAPAAYIARMLDAYPRLVNFVHAENHRSVRWLRHLGFTLADAAPYGPRGAPFHRFEMTRR